MERFSILAGNCWGAALWALRALRGAPQALRGALGAPGAPWHYARRSTGALWRSAGAPQGAPRRSGALCSSLTHFGFLQESGRSGVF